MPSNRADDVFEVLESVPGIRDDLGERQAAREDMDEEYPGGEDSFKRPHPTPTGSAPSA